MASRYPRGDAVSAAPARRDFSRFSLSHPHGHPVIRVVTLSLIPEYFYSFLANESHRNIDNTPEIFGYNVGRIQLLA